MRLGFDELTLEDLDCTLVNPTFTIDFKKNVKEDWTTNYHKKAVDKLRDNEFPMDWFIKQSYAHGYENLYEKFMGYVEKGDVNSIQSYFAMITD